MKALKNISAFLMMLCATVSCIHEDPVSDEIKVGDGTLTVVHTPGHSPGSSCFLSAEAGVMFTGDTLFSDNIGRDDLWGGSFATLRRSLLALRKYDGNLTIYPGHGDEEKLSRALDNIMYI